MASLGDERKATVSKYPIGRGLSKFFEYYSEFVSKSSPRPSCEEIVGAAITGSAEGANRLIKKLLSTLMDLDAANELPSHRGSSHKSLSDDIYTLRGRFPARVSVEAIAILLRHVTTNPVNEESLWSAVYGVVYEVSDQPKTLPQKSYSSGPANHGTVLGDLRRHWSSQYYPGSLEVLRKLVRKRVSYESMYYAKTLIFIQSSGMGKSRLADAFGQCCVMVNFNLRQGTNGFPAADDEILDFVCQKPPKADTDITTFSPTEDTSKYPNSDKRKDGIWDHSLAVGLLQASFETLNTWVKEQNPKEMSLGQLAAARHKEMAPVQHGNWSARTRERIEFCTLVVKRATGIHQELIGNKDWKVVFNKDGRSDIRRSLLDSSTIMALFNAVETLLNNLRKFARRGERKELHLVVVFDEAASLLAKHPSGGLGNERYVAFNRVISCLNKFKVWFFFLSTESQVDRLLPPADPSASSNGRITSYREFRGRPTPLRIFPPFVALQLDIEDRRIMESEGRSIELLKPMSGFSKPEHMKMFGRPLWSAYTDSVSLSQLARSKLIGGTEDPYDPKNINHVFAALSFRLCLDLCLENPRTFAIASTAVNYHMRVVVAVDTRMEVMETTTPSEPIVSEAARHYLCELMEDDEHEGSDELEENYKSRGDHSSGETLESGKSRDPEESCELRGDAPAAEEVEYKWSASIRTLTDKLLRDGVVEKGVKGELYSRFVLTLACDCIHLSSPEPTAPFTVWRFLEALYAREHHKSISVIEPRILSAVMNFNHFTSTKASLHKEHFPELCHDLFRRSAALQLAFNQPLYDHIIPIYFGSPDEDFTPSKCGVIAVQVKNKEKPTNLNGIFKTVEFNEIDTNSDPIQQTRATPKRKAVNPSLEAETPSKRRTTGPTLEWKKYKPGGDYRYFDKMANPILFLLLDLGVTKPMLPPIKVSHTDSQADNTDMWAIHSQGHGENIFGCLKSMGCTKASKRFFRSAASVPDAHFELAKRNITFDRLSRCSRYAKFDMAEEGGRKKKNTNTQNEDIEMAD
ncbi:MAG: hypothetical protein M1840_008505 [Geoglossum simile]|nr:MAG: hypothetical protein M1840_008505 [Geoglossum simile]